MKDLQSSIRDIPDFPTAGILFKDITPLLRDPEAFQQAIDRIADQWTGKTIDVIVGIEARGFIFAAALAYKLGAGLVIVRKPGKLPYTTCSVTYELEYGTDTLEVHDDAIQSGQTVLIVDDVLATGGTVKAVSDLLQDFDAKLLGAAFLAELSFLNGRDKLTDFERITSLIAF
ncbi:adenine phosphoribosyltransferase [candidate division KSB3 bacterium]|uniref:Adenine phosphoribosyltransferase n=1 Tax=candidate division KSB3 bacterium TaxID=2044937 RepID=A0A2G6E7S1_9BACT|nr:MAG: adenine phosphoribosyltransferase [candidate division KSB3 bacterium]PIE30244.1 MAG: adenine phosphoribosyltransferase [candidate division KSB3 bacterium]